MNTEPERIHEPEAEHVLLVEDDDPLRNALTEVLSSHGYEVAADPDAATALERLQSETIDVVVTDLVMPGIRGDALLARVRELFPEIPVIAITAFGSVEDALDLTRAGAADYLTKPFRTRALLDSLARVLEGTRARRDQARLRRALGEHLEGIVGASRPMRRLFERIGRVAPSPAPVLITGESGCGKELVALAVHRAGRRGSFVPVNCGALPEHLLESELFGHTRGAFTGADRDKPGLFEAADGGTLFLDEIGELPLPLQPKLLRAVEAGEVRRIGEVRSRHVDVRLVAATHQDLSGLVEKGVFRQDLHWRLDVLRLEVPPLRERRADVPLLVEHWLTEAAGRKDGVQRTIAPGALAALLEYAWPGNVRELFNVLESAAAFADTDVIGVDDLPRRMAGLARGSAILHAAADREATLAEMERDYILEVLRRTGGNKARAARLLGIPRRTLYRRMDAYESQPDV